MIHLVATVSGMPPDVALSLHRVSIVFTYFVTGFRKMYCTGLKWADGINLQLMVMTHASSTLHVAADPRQRARVHMTLCLQSINALMGIVLYLLSSEFSKTDMIVTMCMVVVALSSLAKDCTMIWIYVVASDLTLLSRNTDWCAVLEVPAYLACSCSCRLSSSSMPCGQGTVYS